MELIKNKRPVSYETGLKENKAFTLVEVIVAVTIFGIMMISIMSVYITANDITQKSDINRTLHENMKNIGLNISEDVMKNGIEWVWKIWTDDCLLPTSDDIDKEWRKFCVNNGWKYYLAKKVENSENFTVADKSDCETNYEEKKFPHCYIVKDWEPLNNNLVTVSNLSFRVTDEEIKKMTMSITLRPAPKSWVKPNLVKSTKLVNQITISERKKQED